MATRTHIPQVDLRVFAPVTTNQTCFAGDSLTFTSSASDLDGSVGHHSIELLSDTTGLVVVSETANGNPNIATSKIGGVIKFEKPGVYSVSATCTDPATGKKVVSKVIKVTVGQRPVPVPAPDPEPTPDPVPTPPTPPAPTDLAGRIEKFFGKPGSGAVLPSNYEPTHKLASDYPFPYDARIAVWEIGPDSGPVNWSDFWSETGTLIGVPDGSIPPEASADDTAIESTKVPSIVNLQTLAQYQDVFAVSPRKDPGLDLIAFSTKYGFYKRLSAGGVPQAVANVRSTGMLQNEALIVFENGLVGCVPTQTSRSGDEWQKYGLPGVLIPDFIPAINGASVTTSCEFLVVVGTKRSTGAGVAHVIALQGACLPFHTLKYTSAPNQGSWSKFRMLGAIPLPFVPTGVGAASNSFWVGPSQTAGKVLGELDFQPWSRDSMRSDDDAQWGAIFANKGYAVVIGEDANQGCILELSPLFNYVRQSLLAKDDAAFAATEAADLAGEFPPTFAQKPELLPSVAFVFDVPAPTVVRAGAWIDRWSSDRCKAYIGTRSGKVGILDTSRFYSRYTWQPSFAPSLLSLVDLGFANITDIKFARYREDNNDGAKQLMPINADGSRQLPDPNLNLVVIVSRGTQEIIYCTSYAEKIAPYRSIRDVDLPDPVVINITGRGPILTAFDGTNQNAVSFVIGGLGTQTKWWPVKGKNGEDFVKGGVFKVPTKKPIAASSANVN